MPRVIDDFPYAGYRVVIFSKAEEQQIEAPQRIGPTPYYNDEALASAGIETENAEPWTPKVVVDRELIIGRNRSRTSVRGGAVGQARQRLPPSPYLPGTLLSRRLPGSSADCSGKGERKVRS